MIYIKTFIMKNTNISFALFIYILMEAVAWGFFMYYAFDIFYYLSQAQMTDEEIRTLKESSSATIQSSLGNTYIKIRLAMLSSASALFSAVMLSAYRKFLQSHE